MSSGNKGTSRRTVLRGVAASAAAASVLASVPKVAQAKKQAELKGAFPNLPFSGELLGPQPGVAKLSGNENPYGPAPSALKMIEYAAGRGAYYPFQAMTVLKEMIAERHGLDPANVTPCTGSAEALRALGLLYGRNGPIVAPRLFYDATALYSQRLGLSSIERAPLQADLQIDLKALEDQVSSQTGMVQLCNPNNPTGLMANSKALKASVKRMAKRAPVVVDEAYIELSNDPDALTCVDLVKQGHNVIVTRTFSKLYGLAGIRVGYTIASADTAREIENATMSWMPGPSLAAAIGCYNDEAFIRFSKAKIFEARDMIESKLDELGLERLPSSTNFVYFKTDKGANSVYDALAAKNVRIRPQYMDYADWSRVSAGHLDDVARFCDALPAAVQA